MKASLYARLLALVLVCVSATPRAAPPAAAHGNWDAATQETVELLRALIRIDTVNPPQAGSSKKNADESALLRYVQSEG
jgi:hypothetical protein